MPKILPFIRWQDIVEIIVIAYFLYRLLLLLKETRAVQILWGLFFLVIASFIAQIGQFHAIDWILKNFLTLGVIVFIIVFQPELRKALAQMGQKRFLNFFGTTSTYYMIDEVVESCVTLSKKGYGAIIVIEREVGLKNYIETGIQIHGNISAELIINIFFPNTPLHDGAVILKNNEVLAAACILPLSNTFIKSKEIGTRHRAALGITEETDAIAVIVSEETRNISIAIGGKMTRNFHEDDLRRVLRNIFSIKSKA